MPLLFDCISGWFWRVQLPGKWFSYYLQLDAGVKEKSIQLLTKKQSKVLLWLRNKGIYENDHRDQDDDYIVSFHWSQMQFSSECNRVDPLVVSGLSRRPHKGLGIRNTSSSRLVFQNLNHFLSSFSFFSAAFLFIYSQSSSFSSQSCTAYSTLSYCNNNNNLRLGICERGLTAVYVVIGAGRSVRPHSFAVRFVRIVDHSTGAEGHNFLLTGVTYIHSRSFLFKPRGGKRTPLFSASF